MKCLVYILLATHTADCRHSSAAAPMRPTHWLTADILMLPSHVALCCARWITIYRFAHYLRTKSGLFVQKSVCDQQKKLLFISSDVALQFHFQFGKYRI